MENNSIHNFNGRILILHDHDLVNSQKPITIDNVCLSDIKESGRLEEIASFIAYEKEGKLKVLKSKMGSNTGQILDVQDLLHILYHQSEPNTDDGLTIISPQEALELSLTCRKAIDQELKLINPLIRQAAVTGERSINYEFKEIPTLIAVKNYLNNYNNDKAAFYECDDDLFDKKVLNIRW